MVRQLNFYSFRKVNRERNTWVYKHDLFKRENPGDLALLRRRTCPTLDGRRQRMSRPAPQQQMRRQLSVETNSDDDSTPYLIATVEAKPPVVISDKKRKMQSCTKRGGHPAGKRPSLVWTSPSPFGDETARVIDTSMLQAVPLTESEDSDDQASAFMAESKTEMEAQSIIVSTVASKLAQYAQQATRGYRTARTRSSGTVTPPFGPSGSFGLLSRNLLTYDDELKEEVDLLEVKAESSLFHRESLKNSDERAKLGGTEGRQPNLVLSRSAADGIVQRVMRSIPEQEWGSLATAVKVADFCMITCPSNEVCLRIAMRELLASSQGLATEFQLYRLALHPSDDSSSQHIWEHEESRCDFVRAFGVFAVNSIQMLLHKVSAAENCPHEDDLATLARMVLLWRKSVGVTA